MPDLETQIAAALVHLEYLRGDVTEIKQAVQTQNGRVRKLETDSIELSGDVEALQLDVSNLKADAKSHGAKWGGIVGGLIAGAGLVWQAFRSSGQ